jgi:hypothetical protein
MLEMERYLVGRQAFPHGKVWSFRCPMCSNTFDYDEPGEPLCTGPSESLDEHPPEYMLLKSVRPVGKNEKYTPPGLAELRAANTLYIPGQGYGDQETE